MRKTLQNPLDFLIGAILVLLPFHVIISVFFTYKLDFSLFTYLKEVILLMIGIITTTKYITSRKLLQLDLTDYFIIGYILSLILITLVNQGSLGAYIYGGRYDFEFFLAFLIIKHSLPFTRTPLTTYLRYFIYSALCMLGVSLVFKFIAGEKSLVHLGFSGSISHWEWAGAPPFAHGIPGASLKRFQGILDGPNQMAYFLLIFMGSFLHYFHNKKGYQVFNTCIVLIIASLIVFTYSRSAYIGLIGGLITTLLLLLISEISQFKTRGVNIFQAIWKWIKKYKKVISGVIIVLGITLLATNFFYSERINTILFRKSSTSAHYERFLTGMYRFESQPLGQGLASSGPASRSIHSVDNNKESPFIPSEPKIQEFIQKKTLEDPRYFAFTSEAYYIPESWYVQQLIEGGIIGFIFFAAILLTIFLKIAQRSIFLAGSLVSICVMNLVLHSFETMYASLILFILMALIIYGKNIGICISQNNKKTST